MPDEFNTQKEMFRKKAKEMRRAADDLDNAAKKFKSDSEASTFD